MGTNRARILFVVFSFSVLGSLKSEMTLAVSPLLKPSESSVVHKVVVEGNLVDLDEWPNSFSTKLIFTSADGFSECSGILVNPTQVLTAGHCAKGRNSSVQVNVLQPARTRGEFIFGNVIGIQYEGETDLAIVTLEKPVKIDAGAFPEIAKGPCDAGSPYQVLGFGLNKDNNTTTMLPRRAEYEAVPGESPEKQIVVRSPKSSGGRACIGDSGAPLLCRVGGRWVVAGIVSRPRSSNVFRNLAYRLGLISDVQFCSGVGDLKATRLSNETSLLNQWMKITSPSGTQSSTPSSGRP